MDKKAHLDKLHYEKDKQQGNLELAFAFRDKEGNPKFSKWKKYLECDEQFISKANNRTIFPNEIIIDIEEPQRFEDILKKVKQDFKFYEVYKTGSRGYHIDLWFDEPLSSEEKKIVIEKYGADLQKATDRCMIALENFPHWKTGNPKTLIEVSEGVNIAREIKNQCQIKKKQENVQRNIKDIKSYKDIPINPEISLNVYPSIFEGVEKISLNPFEVNKIYRIYKAEFGIGHKHIFVITKPQDLLHQGFQSLRLRKIDYDDLFKLYCKGKDYLLPDKIKIFDKEILSQYDKQGLSTEAIFKKEFEENKKKAFFYEKIKPTTNSNLIKAIQKIGFEQMLNDFILENGSIDKRLQYAFRVGVLDFGNEYHRGVSKYNNHNLIITNTKTGKSTQLDKQTRLKYDSATANRLLGYSTGDKSFEGDIQGQYKQIVLDDFSSANYQKEILDSLPSILENGRALIGKGKKQILTECSSQFTLTTNSNKVSEEKELVLEFSKIINRLSETPQRIGSRFACILFGNNFDEATTKDFRLSKKELDINKFLIEQVFEDVSDLLIKLKDNPQVEEFLETKNEAYRTLIGNISHNEHSFYGELKDFWVSTASGDRHHKGFALKQGLIDYFIENEDKLIQLLEGKLELTNNDISDLLLLSEENLQRLNDLNFQSLRNIIQATQSEGEYLKIRFEGLKATYLKELIKATLRLKKDKPTESLIPIIMLNEYLNKDEAVYHSISKIVEKLPKNEERVNRDLKLFGIELVKQGEGLLVQIHKEALEIAYKIETSYGKKSGNGENGEMGKEEIFPKISQDFPEKINNETIKNKENKAQNPHKQQSIPQIPQIPNNFNFHELDKEFDNG